jgi:predicted GIY-YIG superfamily endonuclease
MFGTKQKKCMLCGSSVKNKDHDLCYDCWTKKEEKEEGFTSEDHFEFSLLDNRIYTVYIMFYQDKEKIGYTNDLNSRIIEIKRKYPGNKLVYFREFSTETEARRFEVWLKKLSKRELIKFIAGFQDKFKKVDSI